MGYLRDTRGIGGGGGVFLERLFHFTSPLGFYRENFNHIVDADGINDDILYRLQ